MKKLPLLTVITFLVIALLYIVITQLTVAPVHSTQALFDGIDLKEGKTVSGERLEIERFVGTLQIENNDTLDQITLTASGNDEDLAKLEVRATRDLGGEVNIDLRKDIEVSGSKGFKSDNPIHLTVQMPKKGTLEVHLNSGGAWVADRQGLTELYIDGAGKIETGTLSNDLKASIRGSGYVIINGVQSTTQDKTIHLTIDGTGSVIVKNFQHEKVDATVNGSGRVDLQGIVSDGNFTINGSGEIYLTRITGAMKQHINGAGKVVVDVGG